MVDLREAMDIYLAPKKERLYISHRRSVSESPRKDLDEVNEMFKSDIFEETQY